MSLRIATATLSVALVVGTAPPVVASVTTMASIAGPASTVDANASEQVVVLFKNQFPDHPATRSELPARRSAIDLDQRAVRSGLTSSHARDVHSYSTLNAISATVSVAEATQLASDPSVAQVVKNVQIFSSQGPATQPGSPSAIAAGSAATACPGPNAPPSLEPEALQTMSVDSADPQASTARSLGYDGSGVKVGVIADGIDSQNTEFVRPDGSPVIVDYEDFYGDGLDAPGEGGEAFLDASSIAAQGRNVYDVGQFSANTGSASCRIRIEGVAPGASVVMLKVFGGSTSAGNLVAFLQAIDYAVTVARVDVLNESLGGQLYPDDLGVSDAIDAADDAAVAAGVTVTACSGDEGIVNTVIAPATDPNVISVGATTTFRAAVQTGSRGAAFGVTGWLSNNISTLSSGGFSQQGRTVDVVAPGDEGWTACTADPSRFTSCVDRRGNPADAIVNGGTSESAPLTAGVAALVIQAYAGAHHGAKPSPALVKQILTSTADDIGAPAEQQGSGLVDAYRAVLAARSIQPTTGSTASGVPPSLIESRTQLDSTARAGTSSTFTEQLTNTSTKPVTVRAFSRALGAYAAVKTTQVTLDDTTSAKIVDSFGDTDNYTTVTFDVPASVDRLDAAIAYTADPVLKFEGQAGSAGTLILTLVDPRGRLAMSTFNLSAANHADVQVTDPLAGRWTAYVWGQLATDGGTNGPVLFQAAVARYQGLGTVSPATLIIPAGSTRPVTLSMLTPATPGDTSGSLILSTPGQPAQSIPVALRTLAHLGAPFPGVLTGGNGSKSGLEEANAYYQLDVPRSLPVLNVDIRLKDDPGDQFWAVLIDPSGLAEASQSNGIINPSDGSYSNGLGAALRVFDPAPGRWTLVLIFGFAVSGKELAEPYTVGFDDRSTPVTAIGLPHGQSLPAGQTTTAQVQVTNTGPAAVAYVIDPRLSTEAEYAVPPFGYQPPDLFYDIPAHSSALTVSAASVDGTTPLQSLLWWYAGDPLSASEPGTSMTLTATGAPLPSGAWRLETWTTGPYPQAEPLRYYTAEAVVDTQAFDTTMTSPLTEDPWLSTTGLSPTFAFSPIIAQPGQTVTIPIQITPVAPAGTKVTGTLYIEDENDIVIGAGFIPDTNTVAALPYSYTVSP